MLGFTSSNATDYNALNPRKGVAPQPTPMNSKLIYYLLFIIYYLLFIIYYLLLARSATLAQKKWIVKINYPTRKSLIIYLF